MILNIKDNKLPVSVSKGGTGATAVNFIGVFIQFLKDVKVNYNEILTYRKFAREEINRIESEINESI